MYDICALGEILIDAIASADTSIQITGNAGGAPANVLTCASRMGLKTAFLAKAGDDFIGGWLKRVLDGVGIDTAGLILDSTKNTTIAMVSLDGSGNRSFSFYRTGCADVSLTKEDLRLDRIEQSRVFHFGSVSMTDEPARSATLFAARYAREHGLTVSYDPNLRRNLWSDEQTARQYIREGLNLCDVAKLSDEECTFLCGAGEIDALGHRLLAEHPNLKLLFVTCGAGGSYAFCGSRMAFVPASPSRSPIPPAPETHSWAQCCIRSCAAAACARRIPRQSWSSCSRSETRSARSPSSATAPSPPSPPSPRPNRSCVRRACSGPEFVFDIVMILNK